MDTKTGLKDHHLRTAGLKLLSLVLEEAIGWDYREHSIDSCWINWRPWTDKLEPY